jgi:hypothetical protein
MDEKYTTRLSMVMTASDRGMLQALAAKLGLTESDVIRQHIQQHYKEHFGRKKPPKPQLRRMPKRS